MYFVVSADRQTFLGFEMTANLHDTSPLIFFTVTAWENFCLIVKTRSTSTALFSMGVMVSHMYAYIITLLFGFLEQIRDMSRNACL